MFFFSSRRRHTSCALVTGVQTCALPIYRREPLLTPTDHLTARDKSHRRLLDRRPVIGIFESQHVSCKRIDLFRRDFEVHDIGKIMRILEPRVEGLSGQSGSRSEEHTSELQSLMRISYAVFCLKKKKHINIRKYV